MGEDWKEAAKTAAWKESLQAHLAMRMTGVGPSKARQMVDEFGERILSILNSSAPAAEMQLMKLKGIGKITAARMKASWDKSKSRRAPPSNCSLSHALLARLQTLFDSLLACADPAWVNPTEDSSAAAAESDCGPVASMVSDTASIAEALSWPWPAGSRCYLASMHHAEVTLQLASTCHVHLHGTLVILFAHMFTMCTAQMICHCCSLA